MSMLMLIVTRLLEKGSLSIIPTMMYTDSIHLLSMDAEEMLMKEKVSHSVDSSQRAHKDQKPTNIYSSLISYLFYQPKQYPKWSSSQNQI